MQTLLSWDVAITYGALGLAVMALWTPAPSIRGHTSWLWIPMLGIACLAGLATDLLAWQAPCALALFAVLAVSGKYTGRLWLRVPLLLAIWVAPFVFAAHRIPGFAYPVIINQVHFSQNAMAYSLHGGFDMAAVGVILAGVFSSRQHDAADWANTVRRCWPVVVSTLVFVLGLGVILGFIMLDVKWTQYSPLFLVWNLLFTCVTEEAFFRGFTLAGLLRVTAKWRYGQVLSVAVSALLFGLAHSKGGTILIILATIAGLHYSVAYVRSKRLEAAILTHFTLNAVHFVAFTYPNLSS